MESVTQPVESPTNEEIDEKIDVSNIKIEVSENFNPNTPDELDLSPFVCGVCYSKFTNFEFYVDHLKSHDDVAHLLGPDVINFTIRNETALTYACVKCNTSFPSISEIEKHLLEVECSSDFIISGRTRKAYLVSDTTLSWLDEVLHNDTFGRKWSELGQQADDARNDEHLTLAQEKNGKRAKSKKTSIKKTKSRPEKTKGKDKMPLKINLRKKQAVKARTPRLKIRIENVSHDNTMDIETNSVSTKDEGQTLSQKSVSDNKAALYDNTFNSSTLKEVDDTHDDNVSIDQGEETGSDAATEELQMDTEDATVQSKIKTETATKCRRALQSAILRDPCYSSGQELPEESILDLSMNASQCVVEQDGQIRYKCEDCGKSFTRKHRLTFHIRNIHQEAAEETKCVICLKRFNSKEALARHKKRVHFKEKTVMCELCNELVYSKQDLMEHARKEHGAEKFRCEFCGETFIRSRNHKRHVGLCVKRERLDPSLKHLCFKCGKSYQSPEALRSHDLVKHSNCKRFVCETCGKVFDRNGSYKRHIAKFHNDEWVNNPDVSGLISSAISEEHSGNLVEHSSCSYSSDTAGSSEQVPVTCSSYDCAKQGDLYQ